MTHMRRWGIAEALRDAAPLPRDYPTDVVFATALFGRTLAVIPDAMNGAKKRDPRFPEPAQWVPQYTVERRAPGAPGRACRASGGWKPPSSWTRRRTGTA